jgi:Glyoxalase-like domain
MSVSLLAISLDCTDAAGLASFWSDLLERAVDDGATSDFASIGFAEIGSGAAAWMFHKVPERKIAKNRSHVDLVSDNIEKSVARALELGAKRVADVEEGGYKWTTLTDPAGNEFDVVAAP